MIIDFISSIVSKASTNQNLKYSQQEARKSKEMESFYQHDHDHDHDQHSFMKEERISGIQSYDLPSSTSVLDESTSNQSFGDL